MKKYSIISLLLSINPAKMEARFKEAEASVETRVEPPIALRLDGVGFGEALAGFEWPRDRRVHKALVSAAHLLLERFNASMAFVASDEINLVISSEPPYSGRVEKLVSISAGLASASVSLSLGLLLFFDSRVIPLHNERDAIDYISYRMRVVFNNYVNSLLKASGVRVEKLKGGLAQRLALLEKLGVDPLREPWAALGTCIYRLRARKRIEELGVDIERSRVVEVDGWCPYTSSSSKLTT